MFGRYVLCLKVKTEWSITVISNLNLQLVNSEVKGPSPAEIKHAKKKIKKRKKMLNAKAKKMRRKRKQAEEEMASSSSDSGSDDGNDSNDTPTKKQKQQNEVRSQWLIQIFGTWVSDFDSYSQGEDGQKSSQDTDGTLNVTVECHNETTGEIVVHQVPQVQQFVSQVVDENIVHLNQQVPDMTGTTNAGVMAPSCSWVSDTNSLLCMALSTQYMTWPKNELSDFQLDGRNVPETPPISLLASEELPAERETIIAGGD